MFVYWNMDRIGFGDGNFHFLLNLYGVGLLDFIRNWLLDGVRNRFFYYLMYYLIYGDVDRLLNCDVNRVRMGNWDLHVLRHGDGDRMRHRDANLLNHCYMVRLRVFCVRVTFRLPFVGGASACERCQEEDSCCPKSDHVVKYR